MNKKILLTKLLKKIRKKDQSNLMKTINLNPTILMIEIMIITY